MLAYCSCSIDIAPSDADPMAHALYREYVPLGSVENNAGAPSPLNPATSSATPKGRDLGDLYTESGQIFQGSFSAV